jgi:hypothetical protein
MMNDMNTMKAREGKWLTQRADLPIEERGFFKGLTGIKAKVVSQNIKCTPGCPVSEKAVFTNKLWR